MARGDPASEGAGACSTAVADPGTIGVPPVALSGAASVVCPARARPFTGVIVAGVIGTVGVAVGVFEGVGLGGTGVSLGIIGTRDGAVSGWGSKTSVSPGYIVARAVRVARTAIRVTVASDS